MKIYVVSRWGGAEDDADSEVIKAFSDRAKADAFVAQCQKWDVVCEEVEDEVNRHMKEWLDRLESAGEKPAATNAKHKEENRTITNELLGDTGVPAEYYNLFQNWMLNYEIDELELE